MSLAHVHLILNHVPILMMLGGLALLLMGKFWHSYGAQRLAFAVFVVAAVLTIPLYLTGEPSEEIVEHLPGVSHSIIEEHEKMAKVALLGTLLLGACSLGGLLSFRRRPLPAWCTGSALVLALAVSGLLVWTANLGGQVHHPEIRAADLSAAASESGGYENAGEREEHEH